MNDSQVGQSLGQSLHTLVAESPNRPAPQLVRHVLVDSKAK